MEDKDLVPAQKQEDDADKDVRIEAYVAPAIIKHRNLKEMTKELNDIFSIGW